jgi:hypothetical protein
MAEFFDIVIVGAGRQVVLLELYWQNRDGMLGFSKRKNFLVSKSENPSYPAASAPLNAWRSRTRSIKPIVPVVTVWIIRFVRLLKQIIALYPSDLAEDVAEMEQKKIRWS